MLKSFGILLAGLIACHTAYAQSAGSGSGSEAETPVVVQPQPDSPLRLSVEGVTRTGAEQSGVEIFAKVMNRSDRRVRAYAIRSESADGSGAGGGCFLHNAATAGKLLQPDQSEGKTLWQSLGRSGGQLRASVDFVEFANGTVWGPDTCRSAEQLEGLRAGGRAAKKAFKKKLDERGLEALMKLLYAGDPNLAPPEGLSEAWRAGFQGGVNTLRERLRRANEEGGLPEVEAALQRPFDATDN